MITLLPETRGNLVAIKMSGTVTEDDQDRYFEQAEQILDQEKVEHLLMDWADLEGWAKGARSAGTWFGMHHRALVGRVAIIADEKWADETLRITDIFHSATVRRFPPAERQRAYAWIREE
jgi:SpoIIAA-like